MCYADRGGIMLKVKGNLKRNLTGFMAGAVMMTGMQVTVLADNWQDEMDLHAGATAVINSGYEAAEEFGLQAGAAVYLESQEEVEAASQETIDTLAAEDDDTDKLVMANVQDAVNVRVEPSEEAATAGKLFKNCGGTILEQRDGWTLLESGELTGWTKDEFLLFGEEAAALREEVGAYKATVQTDALRVRKEPNEEAGVYTLLKLGESMTTVEELDGWVAVQLDEDTVGYVSADYVEVAFIVESGKTNEQMEKERAEEEKKKLSANRGAVDVEVSDVTLLAALIQCEAGNESAEGKLAVGAVVMNRVRSGSYPNSVSGVINAPSQFPPATNGKVAQVIASGPSAACIEAAQSAINGATNVGGATHFRAVSSGMSGIVIGNHVFW